MLVVPFFFFVPHILTGISSQNAAIVGSIFNSEGQRLKASLVLLSLGSIALHVIYIKTITWWGLAIGALAMGATLLVPIITLGIGNAHLFSPGNVIGGVATGIRTLLDRTTFTSLASLLFATATLVFSVAGLAYLALPRATLHAVLSITNTPPAVFLWQHLGWGLLVACSTLTYEQHLNGLVMPDTNNHTCRFVLTDAANNAWLEDVVARTLSVGLLLVGVVHLAVLVPVMTKIGVHWLTVVLTGAWGGGVLAAVVGLAVALQPVQQRNGYGTL